jgi:hypothetical protein
MGSTGIILDWCLSESCNQEYLPALGQVASWTIEGKLLTLELEGDEGSLGFYDSRAAGE